MKQTTQISKSELPTISYNVEYYSEIKGNNVAKFTCSDERDIFLFTLHDHDNFFLFNEIKIKSLRPSDNYILFKKGLLTEKEIFSVINYMSTKVNKYKKINNNYIVKDL